MVARVLRVLLQASELKGIGGRGRNQLLKGKKHVRSRHLAAVVRRHGQRSQMVQQPVYRGRRLVAHHFRNHRTVGIDHVRPRRRAYPSLCRKSTHTQAKNGLNGPPAGKRHEGANRVQNILNNSDQMETRAFIVGGCDACAHI